jgi:hypothetical protein
MLAGHVQLLAKQVIVSCEFSPHRLKYLPIHFSGVMLQSEWWCLD